MSITAYIGIGSNEGDREENCRRALDLLTEAGTIKAVSSFYETEPVGIKDQPDFLNAVAALETSRSPQELLAVCRSIEERLGRKRGLRWGPRTADLDILLFGDLVMSSPELVIPHPRMAERRFVLLPLTEIAPAAVHPVLQRTAAQLLDGMKVKQRVVQCALKRP